MVAHRIGEIRGAKKGGALLDIGGLDKGRIVGRRGQRFICGQTIRRGQ